MKGDFICENFVCSICEPYHPRGHRTNDISGSFLIGADCIDSVPAKLDQAIRVLDT
jgi:hypothetical protein